jgi:Tol biopolymer transport system component
MTPDAKYILFYSNSTNLVANDNNGQTDIFVRDRSRGTTTRVNISSGSAGTAGGGKEGGGLQV